MNEFVFIKFYYQSIDSTLKIEINCAMLKLIEIDGFVIAFFLPPLESTVKILMRNLFQENKSATKMSG